MTDNEIIKALECLAYHEECAESEACQYYMDNGNMCDNISLAKDSLDLINRQKAEIERLQSKVEELSEVLSDTIKIRYKEATAEAVKEFAERLKADLNNVARVKVDDYDYFCVGLGFIDNLVKEMVGEG